MELSLLEYKAIVDSSPNMIWRAGLDKKCNFFNKTWLEFSGRTIEQEQGDGWAEGVHPEDLDRCLKVYLGAFEEQTKFEMEYRLRRYDGQYRWINDRGIPMYDEEGHFVGYIGSCMDVTEKIEGQMFEEMAKKDVLCNINNRKYAEILLERELEQTRLRGDKFSLLMLDIDGFKHVNDKYGHLGGDLVLQQLADIITQAVRSIDICGRFGGEEFIVGLTRTGPEKALNVAERLRQAVAQHDFSLGDQTKIHITVSIGVSNMKDEQTLVELIEKADKGLYLAKRSGKNCVKQLDNSSGS